MKYRIVFNDFTTKIVGQGYGEKVMAGKLKGIKSFKLCGTVYDMLGVKRIEPVEETPTFAQIAPPEEKVVSRETKARVDAEIKARFGRLKK